MDERERAGKNEGELVRMPKQTRNFLRPKDSTVEVCNTDQTALNRVASGCLLRVHQAFTKDVKRFNGYIQRGLVSGPDKKRACFVSSSTFERLTNKPASDKIAEAWIADSIIDILVGADPEFVLIDENGNTIHGNSLIPDNSINAELGVDSFGLQIEVRPPPEIKPSKLVSSMRNIMKSNRNVKYIKHFQWFACSYNRFCVGGHLHFGTPKLLAKYKDAKFGFFVVATRILDELVGIPLAKIEGSDGVRRRGHTRFGRHGDFRKDAGRLEWRVPGGDWLAHPTLAQAVIGTSKAICEEILYMIDASGFENEFVVPAKYRRGDFAAYKVVQEQDTAGRTHFWRDRWQYRTRAENNWAEWPICESFGLQKSSEEIAAILHNNNTKKEHLTTAARVLRNMSTYRDYRKEIDSFINSCNRTQKSLSTLNRSIQDTWLRGAKMFK
jgi:hypothetical protein